jgi:hypothetical protein
MDRYKNDKVTIALTRPKIIGPEQNVNLICNSSLYTHIPNIKSQLFYFGITDMGNKLSPLIFTMLGDIDLVFGMRVYSDELQINVGIHSG